MNFFLLFARFHFDYIKYFYAGLKIITLNILRPNVLKFCIAQIKLSGGEWSVGDLCCLVSIITDDDVDSAQL